MLILLINLKNALARTLLILKALGPKKSHLAIIFILSLTVFSATHTGMVDSPDSEVVFRTAESILDKGALAIDKLEIWPEFGAASGLDDKKYSIFGPVESLVLVPFIAAGDFVYESRWYQKLDLKIPYSLQTPDYSLTLALEQRRDDAGLNMRIHERRFLAFMLNPVAGAGCVTLFFLIVSVLGISRQISYLATTLFALATPLWPYTTNYFSEPLAMMFLLASFYGIAKMVSAPHANHDKMALVAGLLMGVAVATHISVILFAPFFLLPVLWPAGFSRKLKINAFVQFCLGLGVILLMLGVYNAMRFGSPFETGRYIDAVVAENAEYGFFINPWPVVLDMLFSPGKGFVLFFPLSVVALFCWKRFYRRHATLAMSVMAALVFRLIFIAARSDWHGGFCLGPRYLVLTAPFFILGVAFGLEHYLKNASLKRHVAVALLSVVMISEQYYFALGEIMSFLYHHLFALDVELLPRFIIYSFWPASPIFHLHELNIGPFMLKSLKLSYLTLFAFGVTFISFCFASWIGVVAYRSSQLAKSLQEYDVIDRIQELAAQLLPPVANFAKVKVRDDAPRARDNTPPPS